MAKRQRSRRRAAVSGDEPAASAVQAGEDTADQATQLAEAQRQVVELTRALKRKAETGARARALLSELQTESDEPSTGLEMVPQATSIASRFANMTSHALQLSMLRQLAVDEPGTASALVDEQTKKAQEAVDFYALVASGIGLLPGMGLPFAGVFATQVLMVRDIAAAFGRDWSTNKTSTAVTALLGTSFGIGIGSGLRALTVSAFPTTIGSVLGVLASPIASYATAQAVGSMFIAQFQNENRAEVTRGMANQVQQARMRSLGAGRRRAA